MLSQRISLTLFTTLWKFFWASTHVCCHNVIPHLMQCCCNVVCSLGNDTIYKQCCVDVAYDTTLPQQVGPSRPYTCSGKDDVM